MFRLRLTRVAVVAHDWSKSNGASTTSLLRPDAKVLEAYLPLLKEELERYPPLALQRCNLQEVIVCGGLIVDGEACGGTVDVDLGRIYLVAVGTSWGGDYARKTVHHEVFHMIDYFEDGQWDIDPAWQGLNGQAFKYGKGGRSMLNDPSAGLPDFSVAGFFNAYSRSDLAEDKAELFSYFMAKPLFLEVRAAFDAILSAKQREMETRLERFCPGFANAIRKAHLFSK
jgi:hypothetical protein